ncbi:MAG: hypothetical protein JWR63_1392 [Conexibacter sp.]|nr:hypothetical protein [Conexibacter sp.]
MKNLLPDEDLRPTHTPLGVDPESQAASLRELRELTNAGRAVTWWRDDRMVALAQSNSISRPDMARAIGLSPSRVDQLIADHYKMLQDQKNAAARERVLRHLPPHLHHLAPAAHHPQAAPGDAS